MIHVRHLSHHFGMLHLVYGIAEGKLMLNRTIVGDNKFDRFTVLQRFKLGLEHEAHRIKHRHLYQAVKDSPIIGEVRGVGMLAAIEFVADPENRVRFDASHKVGAKMSAACLANGLIARAMPHGDILGFAPPLITTLDEINEIAGIVRKSVSTVCDDLVKAGVI